VTTPSLYLGFLIATGSGLVFHLVRGGNLGRLLLYVTTAWIAFFSGHFVAEIISWQFLRVGTLNLFAALLAMLIGLVAASFLAGSNSSPRRKRR
jgi:fucose permease